MIFGLNNMAIEREIELEQELRIRNEQLEKVQQQFRNVCLQYVRAKKRWKFEYCAQLVLIVVLAGINIIQLKL